jgi:PAS domain S-box-containing protein
MNCQDDANLPIDVPTQRFDLLAAGAVEYALFMTDLEGRLLCWNPGAERLFGYRTDEVIGQHFSRFFSPEDIISGRPEDELRSARDDGHSQSIRWQVRKDGSRFWCKVIITALLNEAKQVSGFARVMHDLTVNQQLEAEKGRADSLAEANRGKEEFMAMLSHELRNPLSPILNALSILQQMSTNDPVIEQAGGIIERQVKQMVRLVDDLLDVNRITKGKLRLQTEPIDLRAVMNRAADSARPLLEARRHEFSLMLPTEPLWVEGDSGRLEQVALNLLNNAAKYTDAGGWVRLNVNREGDDAVFRVSDNGAGIPPEMLPRVFDLFTQVDGSLSRSNGGLGVGLALVRSLVEMHGGRVTASSGGLGKGSEFAVKLPILTGAAGRPMTTTLEPGKNSGSPKRVLVVEDNVDAGDSLSLLLRLHGHDVRVARTGTTALEVAATFHPSLALVDIGLPGMDGYEVARRLRANPDLKEMTLCALSGYTPSDSDRFRPQEVGFAHHFVKPVEVETLLGVLRKLG